MQAIYTTTLGEQRSAGYLYDHAGCEQQSAGYLYVNDSWVSGAVQEVYDDAGCEQRSAGSLNDDAE